MEKNIEQDYLAPPKNRSAQEIEQKKNSCQGGGGGSREAAPLLCRP